MRSIVLVLAVAGCSGTVTGSIQAGADAATAGPSDARLPDAAPPLPDAQPIVADAMDSCAVFGAPGQCITVTQCAALGDHTPYTGHCPGTSDIECCIVTPDPKNNPPTPAGWKPMKDAQVTPDMTQWAVDILHDPVTYPMFATTTRTFGGTLVLARVEWHPPDFQNGVVHRGVTLYLPI